MRKILIAEDDSDDCLILKEILLKGGYTVVGEISSGEDVLAAYQALEPDVVAMDILLPRVDGITAIEEVLEFDSKAKVIVISALSNKKLLDRAFELGVIDYITKPFEEERILAIIKSAFS